MQMLCPWRLKKGMPMASSEADEINRFTRKVVGHHRLTSHRVVDSAACALSERQFLASSTQFHSGLCNPTMNNPTRNYCRRCGHFLLLLLLVFVSDRIFPLRLSLFTWS